MFGNTVFQINALMFFFSYNPTIRCGGLFFFFYQRCKYFVKIRQSVLAHFKKSLCENIAYAVSCDCMLCCENSREVL